MRPICSFTFICSLIIIIKIIRINGQFFYSLGKIMNKTSFPVFHLSLITLALSTGFAHAENLQPAETAELNEIKVTGTAVPTRVTRNQLDREISTD